MRKADNFDHAIPAQTVNHNVPRAPNPLRLRYKTASQTERVNTDAGSSRHCLRAGPNWGIAHERKHGPHQQVIAFRRFDAELSRAPQQNAVYVGFGTSEQPVTQRPAESFASRVRRRAIAASWSASLSSGVATIA